MTVDARDERGCEGAMVEAGGSAIPLPRVYAAGRPWSGGRRNGVMAALDERRGGSHDQACGFD